MTLRLRFFAATVVGILACSAAGAQVHNGAASVRNSSARRRSSSKTRANSAGNAAAPIRLGRQASVIQNSPSGRVASVLASSANLVASTSFSGVPGLGFDFPHLAAISGQGSSSFSRLGRNGLARQGSFVPILFGGYPYDYDDSGNDQADQSAQPQPQVIVIQQPVPEQQGTDSANDTGNVSAPSAEPPEVDRVRDVGDFILVRRDGRLIFASLFSVVGTQVQYVTPEGIRRAVALSGLDADATEQMNEARGTVVQIHN